MWDLRPWGTANCVSSKRALGSDKLWAPDHSKARSLTLAATHIVPLVEVHRAGDGGEALIAVMVVGVQGGGYAKMTSRR